MQSVLVIKIGATNYAGTKTVNKSTVGYLKNGSKCAGAKRDKDEQYGLEMTQLWPWGRTEVVCLFVYLCYL